MSVSLLIIDDDPTVRGFLTEVLRAEEGYNVTEAGDGAGGLARVSSDQPDIVLLDIHMPGMSGTEVLSRIRAMDPSIGVIMITSVDEIDTVRETLKLGAYDYLLKPLDLAVVFETIDRAMEQRVLYLEVQRYRKDLEQLVRERTQALEDALNRIEKVHTETILALGSALETRDVETQDHSLRVARYTIVFCRKLGISDEERLTAIKRGAFLHDIGKIGVPDHILRKPAALTEEEWVIMKRHPVLGAQLLEGIEFLDTSVHVVRSHHERWDGRGYPDGLAGEQIPIAARAFAVADALDAITSDRPYREGRSFAEARAIIAVDSAAQFCPSAVAALQEISHAELERIRYEVGYPGLTEGSPMSSAAKSE